MQDVAETPLPTGSVIAGIQQFSPPKIDDGRGYFSETYNKNALRALGIEDDFVQDNHSLSRDAGTLRGLHFQRPPTAQAKLVRVIKGRIWDVAVDIRSGSSTFGEWSATEISAANWNQVYIPIGFAHGFVTLENDTEVIYKVSRFYAPDHDSGILWNDPDIGIAWPLGDKDPTLSDKDKQLGRLNEMPAIFEFQG